MSTESSEEINVSSLRYPFLILPVETQSGKFIFRGFCFELGIEVTGDDPETCIGKIDELVETRFRPKGAMPSKTLREWYQHFISHLAKKGLLF